eukprot:39950-Pyramimonas_sp.AAC.1
MVGGKGGGGVVSDRSVLALVCGIGVGRGHCGGRVWSTVSNSSLSCVTEGVRGSCGGMVSDRPVPDLARVTGVGRDRGGGMRWSPVSSASLPCVTGWVGGRCGGMGGGGGGGGVMSDGLVPYLARVTGVGCGHCGGRGWSTVSNSSLPY